MKSSIAAIPAMFSVIMASPTARSQNLPALPAEDGLYVGSVNEAGQFAWKHQASVQPTTLSARAPGSGGLASSLTKRSGPHCNHYWAGSAEDVLNAVNALLDGCHQTHYDNAIAFQKGGVVAYGCNYGGGQSCNGWEISPFFNKIYDACGTENAGWYEKNEWKASYGYTRAGTGFC